MLPAEMTVQGRTFVACHQSSRQTAGEHPHLGVLVFIACCIPYKFHMESKSFWTWYLLRANSLIRSVLFCCFLKGELHSKCLIIGLCIAVLLISKLSFGSRLTSLWGKGCCATVVSYTIFLQQKSKERELETVVIMHERKSKASPCGKESLQAR